MGVEGRKKEENGKWGWVLIEGGLGLVVLGVGFGLGFWEWVF